MQSEITSSLALKEINNSFKRIQWYIYKTVSYEACERTKNFLLFIITFLTNPAPSGPKYHSINVLSCLNGAIRKVNIKAAYI